MHPPDGGCGARHPRTACHDASLAFSIYTNRSARRASLAFALTPLRVSKRYELPRPLCHLPLPTHSTHPCLSPHLRSAYKAGPAPPPAADINFCPVWSLLRLLLTMILLCCASLAVTYTCERQARAGCSAVRGSKQAGGTSTMLSWRLELPLSCFRSERHNWTGIISMRHATIVSFRQWFGAGQESVYNLHAPPRNARGGRHSAPDTRARHSSHRFRACWRRCSVPGCLQELPHGPTGVAISALPPHAVAQQRGADQHPAGGQQRDAAPAQQRLPLLRHARDLRYVDLLVPLLPAVLQQGVQGSEGRVSQCSSNQHSATDVGWQLCNVHALADNLNRHARHTGTPPPHHNRLTGCPGGGPPPPPPRPCARVTTACAA